MKIFLVLGLLVVSCSHSTKVGEKIRASRLLVLKEISNLRVIDKGRSLLYVSGQRTQHHQSQLYRFDLEQKREIRITHHDGDVLYGEEHPDGSRFFYASTTDELKEKDQMDFWVENRSAPKARTSILDFPLEIYTSRRDGSGIQRITKRRGYDGEPNIYKFGTFMYFVSLREGHRAIYRVPSTGGVAWRVSPEKVEAFGPRLSPDGKKLLWFQGHMGNLELKLGGIDLQKGETQILFTSLIPPSAPSWNSAGTKFVFSAVAKGQEHAKIWQYDVGAQCILPLLDVPGLDDAQPVLSPDDRHLYFLQRLEDEVALSIVENAVEKGGPLEKDGSSKDASECSKSVMF